MLEDIISTMAEDHEVEVVARIGPGADLDRSVQDSGADVVLMSEPVNRRLASLEFLRRHPHVRLITLSGDGNRLRLCELVPREVTIQDVSPEDLMALIVARPGYSTGGTP